MKVPAVVDANVLLSSAIRVGGFTYRVMVRLLLDNRYEAYVPDFLTDELRPKLRGLAQRKKIPFSELESAITLLALSMNRVKKKDYTPYLTESLSLVNDPSDVPYVALALHLREKYPKVILLTYNKKDFKTQELAKRNIFTLTPAEFITWLRSEA